jgi:hypothetical protein
MINPEQHRDPSRRPPLAGPLSTGGGLRPVAGTLLGAGSPGAAGAVLHPKPPGGQRELPSQAGRTTPCGRPQSPEAGDRDTLDQLPPGPLQRYDRQYEAAFGSGRPGSGPGILSRRTPGWSRRRCCTPGSRTRGPPTTATGAGICVGSAENGTFGRHERAALCSSSGGLAADDERQRRSESGGDAAEPGYLMPGGPALSTLANYFDEMAKTNILEVHGP